jgi:hypothetical protein
METLAFPLTVATVFTLGGYGIVQAKRHAEIIGAVLGFAALSCALLAAMLYLSQLTIGHCAIASDICFAPSDPMMLNFAAAF